MNEILWADDRRYKNLRCVKFSLPYKCTKRTQTPPQIYQEKCVCVNILPLIACFSAHWDKLSEHFNFVITIVLSEYPPSYSHTQKVQFLNIRETRNTHKNLFNFMLSHHPSSVVQVQTLHLAAYQMIFWCQTCLFTSRNITSEKDHNMHSVCRSRDAICPLIATYWL